MQEIERKFLVRDEFKHLAKKSTRIVQGYLSSVPERVVRVRIYGDQAFLTIKGIGNASGTTRFEWEKEISVADAQSLLNLCETGVIEKTRYLIDANPYVYEVDEFLGENEGLVIAEIELPSEDAVFPKPDWLGEEVTGDMRYYNSMLAKGLKFLCSQGTLQPH